MSDASTMVGIAVADLNTVTTFFVGLPREVKGTRMFVQPEFLDTVMKGRTRLPQCAGS
jgi:hypothetical protein